MAQAKQTFHIHVVSDLYEAGRTEDGVPYIAEQYYLLAEDDLGYRKRHFAVFNGTVVHVCPEEGFQHFEDVRPAAKAKAERFAARVNAWLALGLRLDEDLWDDVDPAYASEAYVASGTEAKRAFEERVEALFG